MTEFDAGDANTWDANQSAVYETGHDEGERCAHADWYIELGDILDDDFDINPHDVGAWIAKAQEVLRVCATIDYHEMGTELLGQIDELVPGAWESDNGKGWAARP